MLHTDGHHLSYIIPPRLCCSLKVFREQAEGTGLHTWLQLRSLFLFPVMVYDSPKDSLGHAELSLSQVRSSHTQPCVPSSLSPPRCHLGQGGSQAEPRADTGRMWNVEAQGLGDGLWETGGREISSVKGARETAKFLERGPCKERADDMKK